MKTDLLASRHIGINEQDTAIMLRKIGVNSLDAVSYTHLDTQSASGNCGFLNSTFICPVMAS